jgi:hypothetical protein
MGMGLMGMKSPALSFPPGSIADSSPDRDFPLVKMKKPAQGRLFHFEQALTS